MKTFFTSDHHFGHTNIIKYESRPFMDVNTMNNQLIYLWNETVKPDDVVYHLGDFALMKKDQIKPIFDQLNGEIHLILGNHDRSKAFYEEIGFKTVRTNALIDQYDLTVFLIHDPICAEAALKRHVDLVLHGHIHGKKKLWNPGSPIVHVGVDAWDYRPIEFDQILDLKELK